MWHIPFLKMRYLAWALIPVSCQRDGTVEVHSIGWDHGEGGADVFVSCIAVVVQP